MAFLGKGTKSDLQHVAMELGIQATENLKVIELKNAIITPTNYEEEFVKEFLNTVIEERKNKADKEKEKRRREREKKTRRREK